jgi:condensin complex subunit 3
MSRASVRTAVSSAFADAQRSAATHPRVGRGLSAALERDEAVFLEVFLQALNRALVVFAREPAVERVIAFVATFVAGHAADRAAPSTAPGPARTANFASLVLQYLVEHTAAISKAVRFRTCQVLAATLQALPEDAALDEELWEPLQLALLARATDKIPRVRAAAAAALCRLQTTGDPQDDQVAAALLAMLSADSSPAVRKTALASIAVSEATLPAILRRIRDVKEDVRRAAFATIAAKVHPDDLELETRIEVLSTGLKDRVASVRQICADKLLIGGWFGGACELNVFELVELLGGSQFEQEILRALRVIFCSTDGCALLKAIQIDINNLTAADVLLLRAMCEVKDGLNRLEEIIPGTMVYAEVLKYYSVDEFASRNLLAICGRVDLSDEHGRRALENVLRKFFLAGREIADCVIAHAVLAMRKTMLSEEAASRILVEIVLEDVLGDDDKCFKNEVEVEISDGQCSNFNEKNWAPYRALNILKEVFRHAKHGNNMSDSRNAMFLPAIQQAVIPRLASPDSRLRQDALECLALFCLLDGSGEQAQRHLPLFVQACRNDNNDIQRLAFKSLVDFFLMFELESRQKKESLESDSTLSVSDEAEAQSEESPDDSSDEFFSATGSPGDISKAAVLSDENNRFKLGSSPEQIVSLLDEYITNVDETLRSVAAEGLARLLFTRRVAPTPKLLTRLILVYFNPVNEDNDALRQSLSVFFPAFALSSPQHRISLETAFLPALRVLLDSPKTSPLRAVSPILVAQYVLHLLTMTSRDTLAYRELSKFGTDEGKEGFTDTSRTAQERLAESMLNALVELDDELETETFRLYAKVLVTLRLEVTEENATVRYRLGKMARSTITHVRDKRTLAHLRRFEQQVAA